MGPLVTLFPDGPVSSAVRAVSLVSYATVVFAVLAPLGAAVYLVVTTAWTLVERTILRRVLAGRAPA